MARVTVCSSVIESLELPRPQVSMAFHAQRVVVALGLVGLLAALPAAAAGGPKDGAPGVPEIGSRRQLFLDRQLIESLQDARLVLHAPIPREVVFKFDAPWEGGMSGYVTVLRDGDEFRMYYRGGGETTQEVTCLAVSRDGIDWTRPELGLFEFQGSTRNNIIYRGQRKAYWESHNFTPFVDTNPAATPQARYKAMALGRHTLADGETVKGLVVLGSPDGIHWKPLHDGAVITQGSFDSQNVAFWDAARSQYVCYLRDGRPTPHGDRVRSIRRASSADFLHWTQPEWLDFGPAPLEHFYVNNIAPYFREPSLYVGFPMRFVPQRKTIGAEARAVDGVSDAVLISSRDGLHFDRTFEEALLRPGLDPRNWGHAHGNNTPAWGLLPMSPGEMSLYWAEHYGDTPQMRRGVFRVDGLASLQGGRQGGSLVTRALRFAGRTLRLNYSTSAVGSVRVELQDADGVPLPGYRLDDCLEIFGDELDRAVAWKGGGDLSALASRPLRLRIVLNDADLYSFQFVDQSDMP
jgi:hypothetical protein